MSDFDVAMTSLSSEKTKKLKCDLLKWKNKLAGNKSNMFARANENENMLRTNGFVRMEKLRVLTSLIFGKLGCPVSDNSWHAFYKEDETKLKHT